MTIGEKIKSRRKELGLTQEELADKIMVKQPSLSYIERGRNKPSSPLLLVIAMELNLPANELLKMRDEREAG